jgi:pSer/pThr/pTyr-binding forkhead associated (FHA) protein
MSIRCSQGHENPEGSAFCDQCGEQLTATSGDAGGAVAAAPVEVISATPGVGPKLVVQSDGASFDLAGKTEVLIGREDPVSNIYPDVDLTEHGGEEGGVSRAHAKLYISGDQYSVEDQSSTNFTFVNRQKLVPKTPTPVHDSDEIRLGRVILKFQTA